MKKLFLILLCLLPAPALAANCNSFPFTLVNGQIADANQVMSNFNNLLSCANTNLAHNGPNSDITSLSALSTPLSVGQGGTGANSFVQNGFPVGGGTGAMGSTPAPNAINQIPQWSGTAWTITAAPVAKAWVVYNGATQTILSNYNVPTVVKNNTGTYTLNFGTPFATVNYVCTGTSPAFSTSIATISAAGIQFLTEGNGGGLTDVTLQVICFGNQ